MEQQRYIIAATNRTTGDREPVTSPMSIEEAYEFKANRHNKKTHKYFKVAKHPFYLNKSKN